MFCIVCIAFVSVCYVSLTDNLPVATKFLVDKKIHYESGYRLGYINSGKVNILLLLAHTLHILCCVCVAHFLGMLQAMMYSLNIFQETLTRLPTHVHVLFTIIADGETDTYIH